MSIPCLLIIMDRVCFALYVSTLWIKRFCFLAASPCLSLSVSFSPSLYLSIFSVFLLLVAQVLHHQKPGVVTLTTFIILSLAIFLYCHQHRQAYNNNSPGKLPTSLIAYNYTSALLATLEGQQQHHYKASHTKRQVME